ncbi:DNA repair protein RadA [Cedecea neteri]|uniref:DNA repair protein RadA n=1 Tax=Cedecea neteri TaxID=158822 RepID=A0A2X2V6I3_9ENTR|nr:DNA repair protein RadA [Cedecea neteri]
MAWSKNRLAILLAVLHRHGGLQMADQDVFVNVVGGVKVTGNQRRPGAAAGDGFQLTGQSFAAGFSRCLAKSGWPAKSARYLAARNAFPKRQNTAFKRAIVPQANVPKKIPEGMQVFGVKKLADALSVFDDL